MAIDKQWDREMDDRQTYKKSAERFIPPNGLHVYLEDICKKESWGNKDLFHEDELWSVLVFYLSK